MAPSQAYITLEGERENASVTSCTLSLYTVSLVPWLTAQVPCTFHPMLCWKTAGLSHLATPVIVRVWVTMVASSTMPISAAMFPGTTWCVCMIMAPSGLGQDRNQLGNLLFQFGHSLYWFGSHHGHSPHTFLCLLTFTLHLLGSYRWVPLKPYNG